MSYCFDTVIWLQGKSSITSFFYFYGTTLMSDDTLMQPCVRYAVDKPFDTNNLFHVYFDLSYNL